MRIRRAAGARGSEAQRRPRGDALLVHGRWHQAVSGGEQDAECARRLRQDELLWTRAKMFLSRCASGILTS